MQNPPSMGQILREFIQSTSSRSLHLLPHQWKCLHALAACRTGVLGGQWYHCSHCSKNHFQPNSCRNRHCPACQGARALEWLEQRRSSLLPIPYYHLVFTLPHSLNALVRQNPGKTLGLFFRAASQTLLEFGRCQLKAEIGLTAVLHTWNQTLLEHYHLHCVVGGGGISLDGGRWVRGSSRYLFSVHALSRMFRGKMLAGLQALYKSGQLEFHGQMKPWAQPERFAFWLKQSARPKWVVFAKRPFAGPDQVFSYLSRYTHRVAIGNRRLIRADASEVTFSYKADSERKVTRTMTLPIPEFVRRFTLHILPAGFVKIRHYGWLGNRNRTTKLGKARALLGLQMPECKEPEPLMEPLAKERDPEDTPELRCPFCNKMGMIRVQLVLRTGHEETKPRADSS